MSIFAKIAESPEMLRQLAESKSRKPTVDFDGPDGNYVARFNGQRTADKNGNTLCFFEFILSGGDFDASRVSRLFYFAKDGVSEITMDQLVKTCRYLGVDTDKDMDPQLDKVVRDKTLFDIAIVTDKKGYKTVHVNRVHEAPAEEWAEVKVTPAAPEGYDGPSLKGETVKCGKDACVVLSHDMDAGTLVLVNPDDASEIWFENVSINDVVV